MNFLNIQMFLKERFKESKLKRIDFAKSTGIPIATFDRLIYKTPIYIELSTIIKIANSFHVTLDDIIYNKPFKVLSNETFKLISLNEIAIHTRQFIKQELVRRSLTTSKLGRNINVGESTITNFINYEKNMLKLSTLVKIADYFKISINELTGVTSSLQTHNQIKLQDFNVQELNEKDKDKDKIVSPKILDNINKHDAASLENLKHLLHENQKLQTLTKPLIKIIETNKNNNSSRHK